MFSKGEEENKKSGYRIYDKQLKKFKEGYPVFETESEAYESYSESLYQQALDGNAGYDEHSIDEIEEELKGMSDQDLFKMFDYSVVKV